MGVGQGDFIMCEELSRVVVLCVRQEGKGAAMYTKRGSRGLYFLCREGAGGPALCVRRGGCIV